ncbi:DNA recombination protein RmuC [Aquipuribacter hungaricus]|uniref:DNA recombination protein RmuC n=1 Tax=Aquipuribacter hungaricus TaxID=545624 RepID=A0ABV7WCK9_9MICO
MATTDVLLLLGALLLGVLLGAALATVLVRARAAAVRARVEAERDVLRARTVELTAAVRLQDEHDAALAPLGSALRRMESQVAVLERDRVAQYAGLREQLSGLAQTNEALRSQTAALAGALRSPNARGSWGEVQLRRVVEHAGMLARVDFAEQVPGTSASGAAVRPDMVITLPGGKHVVVDAKAPMAAFLEQRYDAHAAAVRRHVDTLAAKEYWTAFPDTPELVVCFVPGEAFLAAACEQDPSLMDAAMAKRVVLATPTTLLALLRTVALTWQQDALAGSARELFDVGRELHARLSTLGSHAGKLGRDLRRAVEDYNAMVASLETRVLVTARRMKDLSVVGDDIPVVEPVDAAPRPLTAAELVGGGSGVDEDRGGRGALEDQRARGALDEVDELAAALGEGPDRRPPARRDGTAG